MKGSRSLWIVTNFDDRNLSTVSAPEMLLHLVLSAKLCVFAHLALVDNVAALVNVLLVAGHV